MKLLPGSLTFCHAQSDRERNNEEGGVYRMGGCCGLAIEMISR